ncbi:MAG: PAS domain-containing protein [Gammaproteobacteria bacterium]|nr:PAS domain-containing protein [Gammaproteobacteria bacterium]
MSAHMDEIMSFDNKVITALKRIMENKLHATADAGDFYHVALDEILTLTQSQYGFIGEVLFEDMAFPYLHVHAIEDRSWDLRERNRFSELLKQGINFRKPDSLFGLVRLKGIRRLEIIDSSSPEISGWPIDHPELKNMIAIPLKGKQGMAGMILLANTNTAYAADLDQDLQVVLQMITHYIEDRKNDNEGSVLNKNEDYYCNLIDSMPGAVCRMQMSNDLYVLDASHQIEGITGYSRDDYLYGDRVSYGAQIVASDRDRVITAIKDAIEKGCPYDLEYQIVNQNGEIYWVSDKGYGLYHSDGDLCYLSNYLLDITERVIASNNEKVIHERMMQAQQMQAISKMAGGMAHDLNNMLASMMGYSELCMEMIEDNEYDKIGSYLKNILLSGERARDVVASMEAFSKSDKTGDSSQLLSVQYLFGELQKILFSALPKTVSMDFDCADGLSDISYDAVEFQKIIVSLCMNSSEAMDGRGDLILSARMHDCENIECASCHELFSGHYIELDIKDNGKGMSKDVISKIFDPFFTTGAIGNGAGMGLAVVHGSIHANGGHIAVNSEEGEGSTVSLYFSTEIK